MSSKLVNTGPVLDNDSKQETCIITEVQYFCGPALDRQPDWSKTLWSASQRTVFRHYESHESLDREVVILQLCIQFGM